MYRDIQITACHKEKWGNLSFGYRKMERMWKNVEGTQQQWKSDSSPGLDWYGLVQGHCFALNVNRFTFTVTNLSCVPLVELPFGWYFTGLAGKNWICCQHYCLLLFFCNVRQVHCLQIDIALRTTVLFIFLYQLFGLMSTQFGSMWSIASLWGLTAAHAWNGNPINKPTKENKQCHSPVTKI